MVKVIMHYHNNTNKKILYEKDVDKKDIKSFKIYYTSNKVFVCEFFSKNNERNGILVSTRNPYYMILNQISKLKAISKIDLDGGYIFLGPENTKKVLAFICPPKKGEKTKIRFRMSCPRNSNETWKSDFELIKVEKTSIIDKSKTNDGNYDMEFRDMMSVSLLKDFLFILKLKKIVDRISEEEYSPISFIEFFSQFRRIIMRNNNEKYEK